MLISLIRIRGVFKHLISLYAALCLFGISNSKKVYFSGILPCITSMGEIYSGSWLSRAETLTNNNRLLSANLSFVNGEQSSFLMIDWRKRERFSGISVRPIDKNEILGGGIPVHSSDVMDFAAMHLSSFERYNDHIKQKEKNFYLIKEIGSLLNPAIGKLMELALLQVARNDFKKRIGSQTIVMIPYFAQIQWRNAESKLLNRPLYLNATYYSLKSHFDRFVIGVQNQIDYDFVKKSSGLNIESILHLDSQKLGYTKLPVAMLQEVGRRILSGNDENFKHVKYVFYVEADMMFTMRSMSRLFSIFQNEKDLVIFPHRLMTYLPAYVELIMKKNIGSELDPYFQAPIETTDKLKQNSLMKRIPSSFSCCSDLLNCTTRVHWQNANSPNIKIQRLYGLPVVIATSHDPFEGGKFRSCNITNSPQQCPGIYHSNNNR